MTEAVGHLTPAGISPTENLIVYCTFASLGNFSLLVDAVTVAVELRTGLFVTEHLFCQIAEVLQCPGRIYVTLFRSLNVGICMYREQLLVINKK